MSPPLFTVFLNATHDEFGGDVVGGYMNGGRLGVVADPLEAFPVSSGQVSGQ